MAMTDLIADMLTRMRNALRNRDKTVTCLNNKVCRGILDVLKTEGYIDGYDVVDDGRQGLLKVRFRFGTGGEPVLHRLDRESKPGCRVYARVDEIPSPLQGPTEAARAMLVERICETDEALTERFLGEETIPVADLKKALRKATIANQLRPVLCGSSLWPDVLGRTWNDRAAAGATPNSTAGSASTGRRRRLLVLDSTVPDAIEAFLARVPSERCLYFVSSKSGSTIEPNALFELIHARLAAKLGAAAASRHFVAITDPGSALEARARAAGFLGIALGRADVGGRFSALSPFGLLPAAAMGIEPERLLARAAAMAKTCGPDVAILHSNEIAMTQPATSPNITPSAEQEAALSALLSKL